MASAGDSTVPKFPIEASHIKKNKYIMLKGHPCKIVDVKTSKTGKHGHMKVNITGMDVLTAKNTMMFSQVMLTSLNSRSTKQNFSC